MTADQLTLTPQRPTEPVAVGPALARHTDPATSREAAAFLTPGRLEDRILAVLAGALTHDEIAARLPDEHPASVKTACSRLKNAGLVADSGQRRPSARGRASICWTLT